MTESPRQLFDRRDVLPLLVLLAAGAAIRAWCFSGFGLGDDIIFRHSIDRVMNWQLPMSNMTYRVGWWLPTSAACALFGLAELPIVLPITVFSVLALAVVYGLGKHLYGRPGAIIAASLAAVVPMDVIWSTMIAPDAMLAFWSALAVLLLLRATVNEPIRFALLVAAGFAFWFAFHTKASAGLLAPLVLFVLITNFRRLGWSVLAFLTTVAVLGAITIGVSYITTGDPLYPFNSEMFAQGLRPDEAERRRVREYQFWAFPTYMFSPTWMAGTRTFFLMSLLPHVALAAGIVAFLRMVARRVGAPVGGPLRYRRGWTLAWVWTMAVFLGLEFNVQYVEGVWVAGFRNLRHLYPIIIPTTLVVAGVLATWFGRWRVTATLATAALVAFGGWVSITAAPQSQEPFADMRWAREQIAARPEGIFWEDGQIEMATWILPGGARHYNFKRLPYNPVPRTAAIAQIDAGYIFTGGGRNPYYGCLHCIVPESQLGELSKWRLIDERPGAYAGRIWRPEPMKLWQRIPDPDTADSPTAPGVPATPHLGNTR